MPSLPPAEQTGSWAFSLLPYLDQEGAYKARRWDHGVSSLACPARRNPAPQLVQDDEYGSYSGGGWSWGKSDYAANYYLCQGTPFCYTMSWITDGSSNTILAGEKALNVAAYMNGSWYDDAPFFVGATWSSSRNGKIVAKDIIGYTYKGQWGAAHASSANFLFADGSIRPLSYGTPPDVVTALLTPRGQEVIPSL